MCSDTDTTLQELDTMFHSHEKAEIDDQILTQLDPMAKGYVELEDLQGLIDDKVKDQATNNETDTAEDTAEDTATT